LETSAPDLRPAGDANLAGRGGLSGFDRLGVYNEQYWFRLLSILQGEYPCTVHLMGLRPFNARAMSYLEAHPPASPFLATLDEAWPDWLRREYREADREVVLQGAAFDRAFSRAVDAPEGAPLAPEDPAGQRLALAPHAAVLRLDWDFPAYRAACLADESLEAVLEIAPKALCMAVWRGADGVVWQKPMSPAACKVLGAFREGSTVAEAFERLEGAFEADEQEDLEANLPGWFEEWTREGILSRAP
jgi:hypothetical protein